MAQLGSRLGTGRSGEVHPRRVGLTLAFPVGKLTQQMAKPGNGPKGGAQEEFQV